MGSGVLKLRELQWIVASGMLALIPSQPVGAEPVKLFDAPSRIFDTGRFGEGANPVAMATGDLDGDGDQDAVLGNSLNSAGLIVMRNNGDQSFTRIAHYPTGTGNTSNRPRDVKLVDFDRDGDLDALATVTNFFASKLYVWRNNGDATFAPAITYPTAEEGQRMIVADLTGDNFPDVAIASWSTSNNLTRLIHNGESGGAAGYGAPVTSTVGSDIVLDLAAADLNGDGRVDLIASITDLHVVFNNGNNSFSEPVVYNPAPTAKKRGFSVAAADMDNDGDIDLIGEGSFEPPNTGKVFAAFTILRNDGTGVFASPEVFQHADLFTGIDNIKTADFNGDGFADIAAGNPTGRTPEGWNLMLSDGRGGYLPTQLFSAGQWTYSIEPTDVDHDGDLDVLTASRDSNALTLFENRGRGAFPVLTHYPLGTLNDATESADIDNDGDIDVVTNNEMDVASNEGVVMVSRNNGNGTFAAAVSYPQPRDYFDMKLRDLNGDNFVDLVFGPDGDAPAYHLGFALNNGDGTFAPTVVLLMNGCGEGTVDAFDLDNDGDREIVFAEEQSCSNRPRNIYIYRNDGNGTFVNNRRIPFSGGPDDLGGADLDGDGRIDLVTIHPSGLAFLRNLGDFNFAAPVISPGPDATTLDRFELADLNRDGRLDVGAIIYQDYYYAKIGTMLGNGDGTFGPVRMQRGATTAESLLSAADIDIADVNGDERPDLNISNYASNDLSVFLTNPDGSLQPQQRYGVGNIPRRSTVADFDGDGKVDFAAVIETNLIYQDYLVVLRNVAPSPLSVSSVRVKSFRLDGPTPKLTIDSATGYSFRLQVGTSSAAGSFVGFGPAQDGSTGTMLTFSGPDTSAGTGFYRIVVEPAE